MKTAFCRKMLVTALVGLTTLSVSAQFTPDTMMKPAVYTNEFG